MCSMRFGELVTTCRTAQARDGQMRMERAHVTIKPGFCTPLLQMILKLAQSTVWIIDPNPQDFWSSVRRKPAASSDGQFKWVDGVGSRSSSLANGWYPRHWNVPQERQGEVQIVLATPACPNVGNLTTKVIDVLDYPVTSVMRNFDGDEGPEIIHRFRRLHR